MSAFCLRPLQPFYLQPNDVARVMTTSESLNFQADRIERVLASHRVPVRVHSGTIAPRWIRFLMTPALGVKMGTVKNLTEELALALGAPHVRVARDGEALAVEVPRPDPEPVLLLDLLQELPALPAHTACLGLSDAGQPLLLRLPAPEVGHVLVAGAAGAGKTELLRTMLASLALTNRQARLQMALIDPQFNGFLPLGGLPHLLMEVANNATSALTLLERLLAEMERRKLAQVSMPRIVVAIDDLAELLTLGGAPVEAALCTIAQHGPTVGLHLLAGVQKPELAPDLLDCFPVRLVGQVTNPEEAQTATRQPSTGAEKLMGRGDFLLLGAGQHLRFQAAWVPACDWMAVREGRIGVER